MRVPASVGQAFQPAGERGFPAPRSQPAAWSVAGIGRRRRLPCLRLSLTGLILCLAAFAPAPAIAAENATPEVGLAVRDITPELPIRLAGYASRKRPADKLDSPLLAQALALKNRSGERFVFVALDNCEVSHAFMQPVLQQLADRFQLGRGAVAVVSSHTHSAPVLDDTLPGMTPPPPGEHEAIVKYTRSLQAKLVEVVGAALADCQPAILEHGSGHAAFAMNRRVYQGDKVVFGDNPDGPVDWDVPVLRIKGTNGAVRAICFGYACHGTSVRSGDDWYVVSGEYMAYARQHLETHQPGATAMFLTGMGADSDPAPRGRLLDAKRHGLELAGAVIGVLDRPMRPVGGAFKLAYDQVALPLATPPGRQQLEQDARSGDINVRLRAEAYLKLLDAGQPLPESVKLPVAVLRLGDDLTFLLMAGEVVVDYSRRLKRMLAQDHPWPIGYAYEVPCYIPSARVIKEGGYEAESSLIYYGFYGPLHAGIEMQLLEQFQALVSQVRLRP
jgi:neutral ceramidase